MASRETKTGMSGAHSKTKRRRQQVRKSRKYTDDTAKCSVDIQQKTSEDQGNKKLVVGDAKFQRSSVTSSKTQKSTPLEPNSTKAQACHNWLNDVYGTGLRGIRKEFITTVKPYVPPGTKDDWQENEALNRYDDVMCLDKTRVKLTGKNPDDVNYVHANFVEVSSDLVYICTQGPMPNTIPHFWQMAVEQGSKVVLQLCQFCEDDGKEKCSPYYPAKDEGSDWKTYGYVQVRILEQTSSVPGMKKVVKSHIEVKIDDGPAHDLTHLLYSGWPDHAVGESPSTCRELRAMIHRLYHKKPIICHCSAGIGRSGSWILLEIALHQLLNVNDLQFQLTNAAKDLRNQRMHSVQNDQQYVFVYRCVIEILIRDEVIKKTPEVTKWIDDYDSFIRRKKAEREKKSKP